VATHPLWKTACRAAVSYVAALALAPVLEALPPDTCAFFFAARH
jgi:hypothetical protein